MTNPNRRLSYVRAGAIAVALAFAGNGALAQDDTTLATVNGSPITEAELALAMTDLDDQFARLPEEQRRAAALTALIEIRLLSTEAEERGLDDGAEFQARMALLRQRALHSEFIENEIAAAITDEAMRARYETEIAGAPRPEEVRARHIIVTTQEEAAAIIAELDGGADFEELAREHSIDGAAAQGGDLGYFSAGQMVPEFEQAAFAMEVGAHSSEPLQTQFGWHVVKVEDKRQQEPPSFEEVSQQIRSLMLREGYVETVSELRGAAEIEITDPVLKAAIEPQEAETAPAEAAPADGAESAGEDPASE